MSAEKVQEHATGQLPPEDVKGIADAVIHDPTVKATDEAKKFLKMAQKYNNLTPVSLVLALTVALL